MKQYMKYQQQQSDRYEDDEILDQGAYESREDLENYDQ